MGQHGRVVKPGTAIVIAVLAAVNPLHTDASAQRGRSPAAQPPPPTRTPQTYTPDEVADGEQRFTVRCGFCHGRDAAGGEGGPDLTRSELVAEDVYGDRIGELIGSAAAGDAHALDLEPDALRPIAAFVHDRKDEAERVLGGRRFVEAEDLGTGDAAAGRRFFEGRGRCAECHSPAGDLAGIATRFEGLALMRRMLNPAFGQPAPAPATASVTLPSGETVTGPLVYRDEFRIELADAAGETRSWDVGDVRVEIDDPLEVHFELLGVYSDDDLHDVYAFLETLR